MKKAFYLLFLPIMLISCKDDNVQFVTAPTLRNRVEINSGWEFRENGGEKWYPAEVPGVIHTDLLRNGLIEEPYYSTNEAKLQWIEEKEWEYQTKFIITANQLKSENLMLDFKGLDTYAQVYVNDNLLLRSDNMFVEWKINIKPFVTEGENILRVVFESAYAVGKEIAKEYPKLPADNDKGVEYKTSVFTRKAPYHFGWDWGPRFVTAGVWKPVFIEEIPGAAIDNVQYIQLSQSDSLAEFKARVTVEVSTPTMGRVLLLDENGKEYGSTVDMDLKEGINIVSIPFKIDNPKIWWPNGMGKPKPTLYNVNAILLDSANVLIDRTSTRLGVREVELMREADSLGESFYFKVNGVPLFMKGANIIPQDVFLPNVTKERYEKLVDVAVESNMNMLRVWGGGIYESDDFYNYCDEQGIFVWQDFAFACGFYPWHEEFYESVRTEARQNIRRLRNHPSLAIWCGNNEIDEAWHKWGYKEDAKNYPWSDNDKINIRKGIDDLFFDEVIPGVLKEEDPARSYHPSSPLFGWGDPRSQTSGDVHYWGVFHGEEPFSVYKDKPGRFSNEYGHESFASYDTWKKWLKEDEMFYLSDAFKVHQKNPKGYRVIKDYMQREVNGDTTNLRDYIYLSQLIQADGIRVAMEGHRQNRPFTQGSLYWQLNDCWPVTSWSSMDYPYGYKALQFFAIHSFAPTILSYNYKDKEGVVELWGVTDELEDKTGKYTVSLIDFDGNVVWQTDEQFKINQNSSLKLDARPIDELLAGKNADEVALKLTYKIDGDDKEESKMFLFKPYKDVKFAEPKFDVSYKQNGKQVMATITAKTLLKAVVFESDAAQQNPSDGYFDMYPGQTKTVTLTFYEEKPMEQLNIKVKTLNSIVRNK